MLLRRARTQCSFAKSRAARNMIKFAVVLGCAAVLVVFACTSVGLPLHHEDPFHALRSLHYRIPDDFGIQHHQILGSTSEGVPGILHIIVKAVRKEDGTVRVAIYGVCQVPIQPPHNLHTPTRLQCGARVCLKRWNPGAPTARTRRLKSSPQKSPSRASKPTHHGQSQSNSLKTTQGCHFMYKPNFKTAPPAMHSRCVLRCLVPVHTIAVFCCCALQLTPRPPVGGGMATLCHGASPHSRGVSLPH